MVCRRMSTPDRGAKIDASSSWRVCGGLGGHSVFISVVVLYLQRGVDLC